MLLLDVVICWSLLQAASHPCLMSLWDLLPFCRPGAASQDALLWAPHTGPMGINFPLHSGREKSAPHNPACFSLRTPTRWLLTTFTRWPGVAEMSQVHSFRLGYLSGQFGLLIVPSAPLSLCSQPAWEREIKKYIEAGLTWEPCNILHAPRHDPQ